MKHACHHRVAPVSSVVELAKVITPENAAEVLPRFHGLSSRDAAMVAATLRPVESPPQRDVVTFRRPAGRETPRALDAPPAPGADTRDAVTLQLRAPEPVSASATPAPVPAPPPRVAAATTVAVEPLDAQSVRLHVTLSREAFAKLEAARDALSHAKPGASPARSSRPRSTCSSASTRSARGPWRSPGRRRLPFA